MKRTLMSVVMLGFSAAGLCQTPYWQDVSTVEVNREAPRTEFVTYTSEEKALTRDFSSSENYQLLNGNWKFLYYDSYKDVPASVTDPATDDSSWNEIKVPGNWELQGYGTAIYVNHPYEFSPVNPQPPQLRPWESTAVRSPWTGRGPTRISSSTSRAPSRVCMYM